MFGIRKEILVVYSSFSFSSFVPVVKRYQAWYFLVNFANQNLVDCLVNVFVNGSGKLNKRLLISLDFLRVFSVALSVSHDKFTGLCTCFFNGVLECFPKRFASLFDDYFVFRFPLVEFFVARGQA